jgi:polysaccharide chain length determinant protein (PEP-CTERM system associated)
MDELVKQLMGFARGMWKFRWPAVALAWVVAIAGVIGVFRIPDQYEASARIYVDTQSILKPLMAGLTVQPNVEQQVAMLSRTLLSRPNLERLVRMADLDLGVSSPLQQEALITDLGKAIQIRNTGRDNLYTLAIRDNDQEKAKRIVQSLTSIFVESSLGASRKDTDSARSFLDEQIRRYEIALEEAEARLKAFRLRNIETQSADGRDAASRVSEANTQFETARLQLREAENARDAIKQQLAIERGQAGNTVLQSLMMESSINISTPELDARIGALKANLDALLQRYTDQHPDVITTRRLIGDLEQQKETEMAEQRRVAMAQASAAGSSGVSMSPAAQELNRMLASAEVQVATLRTRVNEFGSRLQQAREGLRTAPALEAEAAQLNRDYTINKKNYEDLVSRRQAAIMSGELEVASGVADFRLIDPPRVSPKPVAPNRLGLLPLALIAGLGAGLGLAFLLSQLRPAFYDPTELRAKTGVPLLGVVSMRIDPVTRKKERNSLWRFAGVTGGLVGLFGVGMAVVASMA